MMLILQICPSPLLEANAVFPHANVRNCLVARGVMVWSQHGRIGCNSKVTVQRHKCTCQGREEHEDRLCDSHNFLLT